MSVFNGARYLREAVESILGQRFRDYEFIIIDDGSTDASREIISCYDDRRIRLMVNEANLGLPVSLNKGIRSARGEYIARQDADDVSLPDRLELQTAYLDAHPEVALVGCWWERIDEKGRVFDLASVPTDGPLLLDRMLEGGLNPAPHGSMVFRKQASDAVGGYDERFRYTQDFDLWLRMWSHGKVEVLPSCLYELRESPPVDRFKSLCQGQYYHLAVEQFRTGRRCEFQDVPEVVRRTYRSSKNDDDHLLSRYWAGLGAAAATNRFWRLSILYHAKALRHSRPSAVARGLGRLFEAGFRRIVSIRTSQT